ncbi:MAG: transglycosylase domain-containing protein, partial [Microgenomates group bacterium]
MKNEIIKKLAKIKNYFLQKKLLILILFFLSSIFFLWFFIFYKLPSPYGLKNYKIIPLSTHIYDRNGKLLYEIYREQNRTAIKLKDLPRYVIEATIAIEDKDFYKHKGISILGGILRAIKDMVLTGKLQGGSTITQQLVKSSLLTPERSIKRKIKEIILALWTEQIFTKDEILELYLNQVPYGGASYGIEEASRRYFNKKASQLKLEEAAFLAGLPQAPSLYSPYLNPELAKKRRNEVLKAMFQQKYIDKETYEKAIKTDLIVSSPTVKINAPHFVFYVKQILEKTYGVETVEKQGLKVTTTLDLDIQKQAEKILKEKLEKI